MKNFRQTSAAPDPMDRCAADMTFAAAVRRLLNDDSGEDIVEYGLLGALIGIAAVLIWQQLVETVDSTYTGVVALPANGGTVQTLSACTPDPGGGGCP
jgi:Flp pilus assembly pilin Flp